MGEAVRPSDNVEDRVIPKELQTELQRRSIAINRSRAMNVSSISTCETTGGRVMSRLAVARTCEVRYNRMEWGTLLGLSRRLLGVVGDL